MRILSAASVTLAVLQSVCAAILAVSGIRVAIGLTALASVWVPVVWFHQDAIRIPMLILATLGAVVNLAVLAWIRHLRGRPSAQWRKREISLKQKRMERLQVAMAIVTLLLVGTEFWMHAFLARKAQARNAAPTSVSRAAAIN